MADTKISAMTAATALARADLIAVVQDVSTTPVNKRATIDVLDPGRTLGGTATGGASAVAVGNGASAGGSGLRRTAVGNSATTSDSDGTAIGASSTAGYEGVALGRSATTQARNSNVAIGAFASTGGSMVSDGDIAIGRSASTSGSANRAVAIGRSASATQLRSVAIGGGATSGHSDSVALGGNTSTTATSQVMVGPRDIEITGIVKGIVLEDRTLNTRHRVYLDNGTLTIEAA